MPKQKKDNNSMLIGVLAGCVIVLSLALAYVVYSYSLQAGNKDSVNSFEECAAAGNPVAESYPRQCWHKGKHFVEQVPPIVEPEPEPQPLPDAPDGSICVNTCGDGQCAEIVCLAEGCPCAESPQTCPADCQ